MSIAACKIIQLCQLLIVSITGATPRFTTSVVLPENNPCFTNILYTSRFDFDFIQEHVTLNTLQQASSQFQLDIFTKAMMKDRHYFKQIDTLFLSTLI